MSNLSSFLLPAGSSTTDRELDALFSSRPSIPSNRTEPSTTASEVKHSSNKRKRSGIQPVEADRPRLLSESSKKSKKSKESTVTSADLDLNLPTKSGFVAPSEASTSGARNKVKKEKKKRRAPSPDTEDAGGDEDTQVEQSYLKKGPRKNPAEAKDSGSENESASAGEMQASLVHETVSGKRAMRQKAAPFVPADETPAMREARTIFIGNISVDVPQKKSSVNQLRRHILAHVPTAKIESMRFRSVPFQKPTTKVEDDDSKAAKGSASRDHDRERASSWRKAHEAAEESTKGETKQYLTPQQKKKVAFINHEFNTSADTVHAYIVFAHPPPPDVSTKHPANLPPLPPTMDPYEAACAAAEACDGTMFLERVIRVDVVGALDGVGAATHHADPKLSVFVGNLDFETREREVRSFFEGVLSAARGPPPIVEEGETSAAKPKTWVTRVRLVRDRDTQLGKGFAYVQFADTTCVDEILAKEPGTLKLAKRKLRVQRCRKTSSVPAKSAKATAVASIARSFVKFPPLAAVPVVQKGDPTLGTKLANMSKEARKEYKAADVDRVARRLAKKKARNTLAVRPEGKDRDRVRKSVLSKGKRSAAPEKKKTRVRSEKSLANRNRKK